MSEEIEKIHPIAKWALLGIFAAICLFAAGYFVGYDQSGMNTPEEIAENVEIAMFDLPYPHAIVNDMITVGELKRLYLQYGRQSRSMLIKLGSDICYGDLSKWKGGNIASMITQMDKQEALENPVIECEFKEDRAKVFMDFNITG